MQPAPAEEFDWYSEDTATFGDRIAGAREALGLTQEDVARRLGIKPKTVRNWENDVSEPRANKLQMLAGVLNVSIRWLLTGEGEGISAPQAEAIPEDIVTLLAEMREAHGQLKRATDRVAVLEKRLRTALEAEAG